MHRPAGLRAQDARAPGERRDVGEGRRACNAPTGSATRARQLAQRLPGRRLSTAAGDVTLKIPEAAPRLVSSGGLIERYCRVDAALVAAVAEMYVMGISTRKVEAVAGGARRESMSKSQVSRLCGAPGRRGGRVQEAALRRGALRLPVARRHREVPRGGALGVPGRRDRDQARRHSTASSAWTAWTRRATPGGRRSSPA